MILNIFILSSCSKEYEYDFYITNHTDYDLKEVRFDWCSNNFTFSVKPNSTYGPFTLAYKTGLANFFGDGSLCYSVSIFSDSIDTFENKSGRMIGREDLKPGNLHEVSIFEKEDVWEKNPNAIFDFVFN
ncbi:MAG: hypothetical protein JJU02_08295 [Cryomorphaceae bacterium]|nr:hypothetical protein [Cryomorphaceae bacterium]